LRRVSQAEDRLLNMDWGSQSLNLC
jgi:hypothetical protein